MADFDPYYQWLAIPPKDQPPNHYRLLAVELFESNTDVIANAADQRMAHVRSFQAGKHSGLSQELLNEIAAAKICLLNPAKKDAYDETLRKSQKPPLSHPLPPPPPPAPPAPPPAPEHSQLQFRSAPQPSDDLISDLSFLHKPVEKKPTKTRTKADWLPAMVVLALLAIAIGAVAFVLTRPVPKPEEVAQVEPKKVVQPAPAQPPAVPPQPKPQLVQPAPPPTPIVPKPEPAVQPKLEPAVQPKLEPIPQLAVQPKPEPKVEPKSEPKVEPKPEPKVESTPDPTPAPKKKLAVPDEAALKKALALIRETYKEDYRASDKATLAKKLLQKADENKNDMTVRFVLLQEAKKVAVETGQGELAFNLIDLMASEYDVNGPEMKAGILEQVAKKTRLMSVQKAIAEAAFEVMDEAIRNDDFNTTKRIGKLIGQMARLTKDKDLIQDIQLKNKDVETYEKAFPDLSGDDKDAKRPLGRKSWISRTATYTVGSVSGSETPLPSLLTGEGNLWNNNNCFPPGRFAFHTLGDKPFIVIDLQKRYHVKRIVIENRDRGDMYRPGEVMIWLSIYPLPRSGVQVWKAEKPLKWPTENKWNVILVPVQAQYITIAASNSDLFLTHVWVYGY